MKPEMGGGESDSSDKCEVLMATLQTTPSPPPHPKSPSPPTKLSPHSSTKMLSTSLATKNPSPMQPPSHKQSLLKTFLQQQTSKHLLSFAQQQQQTLLQPQKLQKISKDILQQQQKQLIQQQLLHQQQKLPKPQHYHKILIESSSNKHNTQTNSTTRPTTKTTKIAANSSTPSSATFLYPLPSLSSTIQSLSNVNLNSYSFQSSSSNSSSSSSSLLFSSSSLSSSSSPITIPSEQTLCRHKQNSLHHSNKHLYYHPHLNNNNKNHHNLNNNHNNNNPHLSNNHKNDHYLNNNHSNLNNNNHSILFHSSTMLPLHSSPIPAKRLSSGSFDYDCNLNSVQAIKNSLSCSNLSKLLGNHKNAISSSVPFSSNCLLGSFEESLMKGRIEAAGVLQGFRVDVGASGAFHPAHVSLPCRTFYFALSDDAAPSPYLGHVDLESYSKKGYRIPSQGTVQLTLFNPNNSVVKIFVIKYDVTDMPSYHQTLLRQRTLYMPIPGSKSDVEGAPVHLRYLVHLRLCSTKKGHIYLHTDIRLIFARDGFELDSRLAHYELRSFNEVPHNPTYSPLS